MARPIWKGNITFGLVNVPATLFSAEKRDDLHFNLVDSRNKARVRYQRVNDETGEEVPWGEIVKGYEYEEDKYVLFSDEELESASPELTRLIEIEEFVEINRIDMVYFDKPYYLVPGKGGEKGYVLLREALNASGRVGLAKVVIRTRQYLSALMPEGDALILNLLRYQQELRRLDDFDFPGHDLRKLKVTKKEIDLAVQLIDGMSTEWQPDKYHDEYREALMTLINKKVKSGGELEIHLAEEEEAAEEEPEHINFMELLKKSMEGKPKKGRRGKKKKAG